MNGTGKVISFLATVIIGAITSSCNKSATKTINDTLEKKFPKKK